MITSITVIYSTFRVTLIFIIFPKADLTESKFTKSKILTIMISRNEFSINLMKRLKNRK